MKKIRLAIIAAAMITSLLPLNSFAATITASGDKVNKGIAYDITSDSIDDFTNGFNVSAGKNSQTVKFDTTAIDNWSGYTTFTGKIIIEKVLDANAEKTTFAVGDTEYNLYTDYAKTTDEIKGDEFAQEIYSQAGVVVTKTENDFVVDGSNPMYTATYNDGVLSVKDVVNGTTAKNVKITIDGKPVAEAGKVVTGDSVNVMFDINDEKVLTDANERVWTAAERMDSKLAENSDHGVASIAMNDAGKGVTFEGVEYTMSKDFGDWAAFTLKANPDDYTIKSFAGSGVIELFQAMFGDVVKAEITALAPDTVNNTIVATGKTSTIEGMNNMTSAEIKTAVAEHLIKLLLDDGAIPGNATMTELVGKAATAKVTFADDTVKTYSVAFLPNSAIVGGETTANVNE